MSNVDFGALAAEVRGLCKFLVEDLGMDRPASHYEEALDRLWHVAHVIRPSGKLGLASMDHTLVPALFLLSHPGVGCERSRPHSPPSVTDLRMVGEYRRMAALGIKGFLLVQELYDRPLR